MRAAGGSSSPPATVNQSEALATLERLSSLKNAGVISEEEFQSKKAQILSRL
jgi:hypothetical protein